MPDPQLVHCRQQYRAWLSAGKPLLEAGTGKQAFATYRCYREAPWPPQWRPVRQSTVALVTTAGLYLKDTQAPCAAANIEGAPSYRVLPHGAPGNRGQQRQVLLDTLATLEAAETAGEMYPLPYSRAEEHP